MKNITFNFIINDKVNREGLQEIFLKIYEPNGTPKKIKTSVFVKNEHFGVFKDIISRDKVINKRVLTPDKWVTNKDKESTYKNDKLSKLKKKYEEAYDNKKDVDGYVDKESVIKAVQNKSTLKDVCGVFQRFIDELHDADNYPTEKGFITAKIHLEGFLLKEYKTTKIDFRHINKKFLVGYEKYLFKTINGDEPCSDASVHAQIKRLRRIFNYAIAEEIITPEVYPFKSYKLPTVTEKYKKRLDADDIKLFEKQQYEVGTGKHNTQNTFMLAIRMAGTRIEDMFKLKVKYIIDGRITFNMNKGNTKGKLISIEITPKIQAILDQYITKDSKPDDYILPFLPSDFDGLTKTDQKKKIGSMTSYVNGLLKEIGDDACISTKITTHIARHTFASAVQKVTKDIESVSKALGHSDVKITQRYLEELNVGNQDEMMKSLDI